MNGNEYMEYYLDCRYDSRQSFYKKAKVVEFENNNVYKQELQSYSTLVANYVYYKKEKKKVFEYFGYYSQTTGRHQKEFFRQLGLNEKQLKELINNGRLEVFE